ncbi:MAG: FlgD immunoglobulin-like domain containing protein [Brevinematia bacterium]
MKNFYKFLGIALIFIPQIFFSKSIYYYEPFSDSQATLEGRGWIFNFPMSRDMIIYDVYNDWGGAAPDDNNYPKTNYVNGGRLKIMGTPNNIALFWNNWFCGSGVKFDPKSNSSIGQINVSEEEPFGYTIIRYTTSLDARGNYAERVGAYVDVLNQNAYSTLWIVQDNGVTKTDTNSRWDYFLFFYDKGRIQNNNNTWGYYKDVEHDISFTSLTADIDGNNPGTLTTYFQRQYDDQAQPHFNNEAGGYSNPVTEELAINLVHSGSKIIIYLNPNPAGDTGPNNTWIKFAEVPVGWSNDIVAFIGNETGFFRGEPAEAQFDNFLIRSIASNVVAKITPTKVMTNSLVQFSVEIEPQNVATQDSGIGEIYIKKPTGYGNWQLNTVSVSNSYSPNLTRITSGTPGAGQFLVQEKDGELYMRFQMASQSANQIVRSGKILVRFTLQTPSTSDGSGKDFSVYVDCRKHSDTGIDWMFDNANGIKYATTGRKKAKSLLTGDLNVKVYTQPVAYAYLQSSPMVVGQDVQSVTVRIDGSGVSGSPDISYFRIQIPAGFTVSNNDPIHGILNIVSSKVLLGSSISNIYLTNISGTNYIFVNYMTNGFDGVYGFDMINFNVYGTPSLPLGMLYSNYHWNIDADSSAFISGAVWTKADTPNSYLRVVASNAMALAYVYPSKVSINGDITKNTNRYAYTLRNVGTSGNNIYRIRINIPNNFDSVQNIVSSNGGNTAYSNSFIWVDYGSSPLLSGQIDTIEFTARHTNTNVYSAGETVSLVLYADNSNSMGYVEQQQDQPKTWSVFISPPVPQGENKLEPFLVYTTFITNEITNIVVNLSPRDIDVKMLKIDFNTNYISEILSIQSLLIGNNYTIVTNGSNYSVYLNYEANSTNLASWYRDMNAVEKVVMKFVDRIGPTTFSSLPTNIALPTYLYKISSETNDTNLFSLATQKSDGTNTLRIEYPPVSLVATISPSVIDTTSVTNVMTMYFTNTGMPGNRIHNIYIPIQTNISTNIYNLVLTGGGGVSFNSLQNRIELTFSTPFDGGETRTLSFTMVDRVESMDIYNVPFLPSVSNDRDWEYNITNGNSYVSFFLPKPKGGGGVSPSIVFVGNGDEITQTVRFYITNSGSGTDNFQRVKLILPEFLNGNLIYAYSTKLNLWNTNSSYFNISTTDITITYPSAQRILAGEMDVLELTLAVGSKSLPTNGVWKIYADNGFVDMGTVPPTYFFEITNVTIGNRTCYATRPISYNISDNFLTTETRKTFEITIQNGSTGNIPVRKIGINIPWPFSIDSINDVILSGYPGNKTLVTNWLWIDYTTPLPENQSTTVRITANKELLSDSTNVRFKPVYIYTNDNISYLHTNIVGSDIMYIILPDVSFYAYVNPNNVSRDEESVIYTFTITNVGEIGNDVYRLKITPPSSNEVITNIELVSGRIKSHFTYSNDGSVYIDYFISNTNIQKGDYDVISLKGYDNQIVEGFSGSWKVYGVNTKTGVANVAAKNPAEIGKSLLLSFIVPPYNSLYSIASRTLNTLDTTNNLTIIVNNTGESGNDITGLRIYFFWPFITNGAEINSSIGGSLSKVSNDGTNFVEIKYDTGKFTNGVSDTIVLKLLDTFAVGDTNTHIFLKAMYSTSGENYIKSELAGGETNQLLFKMPYPDLASELLPSEIYFNQTNVEIGMRFINKGQVNNNIQWIKVKIPDVYTNNFDISKVSDTLATNKNYADGVLSLFYNSFYSQVTNLVTLKLSNSVTNIGDNFAFEIIVYNGLYETTNSGPILSIQRLPAIVIQSDYRTLYSTYVTNTVKMEIDNGVASGSSSIKYARLIIPDIFTNIVSVESIYGNVVSNFLSNLVIYYPNGIAKGNKDTLTLNLIDKYDLYKTNEIKWDAYINNGSGYACAIETFSFLTQSMVIPKIDITNLNPIKWVYIGVPTNTIVFSISNKSIGNNYAFSNIIELPSLLDTGISFSNTHADSVIKYENSKIIVTYSSGFKSGSVDNIYFELTNGVTSVTDFNVQIKSYNGSDYGPGMAYLRVSFKGKDEIASAYLKPKAQIIYSIDNTGLIKYYVQNNMYDKGIKELKIDFDTTRLNISNIYSSLLQRYLSFTKSSTNLIVSYGNDSIIKRTNDELIINIVYTNTQNWTNVMKAMVKYEGMDEYFETLVPEGESVHLPVLLADFGRITGIVLPPNITPKISVVDSSGAVVTNKTGEKAIAISDTEGKYLLDYVLPGTYRLQFTGTSYSTNNFMEDVVVIANKVTNVGVYKMKKAVFSPNAPGEQESLCLDDLKTTIIVPEGSMGDYFSVDIWLTNFTVRDPDMKEAAKKSKIITPPAGNEDSVKVYHFDMKGMTFDEREEQELKKDVIIKLAYDKAEIEGWGWNEDKLAVFYWRPMTKEWRRIGGVVDKENGLVTFKSGYLHKYYAIMGDAASKTSASGFVNVSADPKVFTPGVKDRRYKNMKLAFGLEESVEKVYVKIYDMRGNLLRQLECSGEYKNGEVYWDGKDSEGYDVKTGVYIYKIIAGSKVYSGTIIIAR